MNVWYRFTPKNQKDITGDGFLVLGFDEQQHCICQQRSPTHSLGSKTSNIPLPAVQKALVAMVDGLGHGKHAAEATDKILTWLNQCNTPFMDLIELVHQCHKQARDTRGAAIALMQIDFLSETYSYVGIGNIRTHFFRQNTNSSSTQHLGLRLFNDGAQPAPPQPKPSILQSNNGIVGYRFPDEVWIETNKLPPNPMILFCTDGIQEAALYDSLVKQLESPKDLIDYVWSHYRSANDDTMTLVLNQH